MSRNIRLTNCFCGSLLQEHLASYDDFQDVPSDDRQRSINQEEQSVVVCHVNNTIDDNVLIDHLETENLKSQSSELTYEQVEKNKFITGKSGNLDTSDRTDVNTGNDELTVEQSSDGEESIRSSVPAEEEVYLGEQYVSKEPNCSISGDKLYSDVSVPPGHLEFPQGCSGTVSQALEYYGQPYMSFTSPWSMPPYPAPAPKHLLPPVQYHPPPPGFVAPHMAHHLPVMHPQSLKFHGKHFLPPTLNPLDVRSQVPMFGQPRTKMPVFHPFSRLIHADHYSSRSFGESRHDTYRPLQNSYNTSRKSFDIYGSQSSSQGSDDRSSPLSDEENLTGTVSQNRDTDLTADASVIATNKRSLVSQSACSLEAVETSSSGFKDESINPVLDNCSDLTAGVNKCCNPFLEHGDGEVREDVKNAVTTYKDVNKNLNDEKGMSKIAMPECFNSEECFQDESFRRKRDTKFTKLSKKEHLPVVAENGFACSDKAGTDFHCSSSNVTQTVEKTSEVHPGSPNVTSVVSTNVKRTNHQHDATDKQCVPKPHDKSITTSKASSKQCGAKNSVKNSAKKHTVRFADQLPPTSLKENGEETSNNKGGHLKSDYGIGSDVQRINTVSQNNSGEANHPQKRQGILKNSPPKDQSESQPLEPKKQTAKTRWRRRNGGQSKKGEPEEGRVPSGFEKTQDNGKGISELHGDEPRKNHSSGNPSRRRTARPFRIRLLKPPQEMPKNSAQSKGEGRFKKEIKPDKNNNGGKTSKVVSAY